ncbi:pyridoxal phosphate-dependent transferase [Suillus clintonianus]|uniref:pyridoxal phosphate-dependent transferase n=1 Tax=Suillus clintonianus TaxID=1904413 RepID=UPI001B8788C0|nr:pyridoxal phosphate-dependent transferase [Suillus clintonianus]KAG2131801.1 pyridoxal phosphate-dependent transferase [Suillus clintonianus]
MTDTKTSVSSESAPSTPTADGELDKQAPPLFGHAMHKLFEFDPSYVNLNHGSYGSLPMPVRVACDKLSTRIESNPDKFLRIECIHHWIEARTRVARLIGADTDECVLVNNTLHGISTILRNFEWHEGDIIIGTNTTYNAVSRAIRYLGDIPPYPQVSTFNLQFPTTHAEILENWREHIRRLTSEKSDLQQTRKVVAVVDAIAANPGVRLPWKEMVAICRDAGVWSVVDAAHSIGQEVDINLSEVKPDFWVSTCHKWLFAKRSCAVLYVPKRNQHIIKSCIPTPRSYHSPQDEDYNGPQSFVNLFEWTGTIDYVPFLSVNAALDFRQWLGGEHKINEYTHNLAIAGGKYLASLLGTSVMDPTGDLTLNMVNVELPIPGDIKYSNEINNLLKNTLLIEWNAYAVHYHHNGKWWTRCSVQVWNEISDFEVLANAFKDACQKVVKFAKQ